MMGVCFNTFKEMNKEVYGINITKYDTGGDYEVYDTSYGADLTSSVVVST